MLELKGVIMSKVKINKLIVKKHIGYSCVTVDKVIFETNKEKSRLTIDNFDGKIFIDLTPHTIDTLYELFRYIKSDLDDPNVE